MMMMGVGAPGISSHVRGGRRAERDTGRCYGYAWDRSLSSYQLHRRGRARRDQLTPPDPPEHRLLELQSRKEETTNLKSRMTKPEKCPTRRREEVAYYYV